MDTKRDPIKCIFNVKIVSSRATFPVPPRYAIELARKTWMVMYTSKACDRKEQAEVLAKKYLAKHPELVVG